jgi:hypothetical protein
MATPRSLTTSRARAPCSRFGTCVNDLLGSSKMKSRHNRYRSSCHLSDLAPRKSTQPISRLTMVATSSSRWIQIRSKTKRYRKMASLNLSNTRLSAAQSSVLDRTWVVVEGAGTWPLRPRLLRITRSRTCRSTFMNNPPTVATGRTR